MKTFEGRVMALDIGTRRIGVAVSDLTHTIAQASTVFHRRYDGDKVWFKELKDFVENQEIMEIVIGLPLHMSGDEGDQARFVRELGDEVAAVTGLPIHYIDERWSTVSAERVLIEAGLTREKRKGVRDSLAAQVFLQSYLDGQKNARGNSTSQGEDS